MTIRKIARKRKTFKSGITTELAIILAVAFGSSVYLINYGTGRIMFLSSIKLGSSFDCYVSGYFPIGVGTFIIIVVLANLFRGLSQFLVVTPQSLAYQKGKLAFNVNWETLVYSPPKKGRRLFRSFCIGTGKTIVRVESIFFSKFDTLSEVIRVAKESRKTKMLDDGIDIDEEKQK